MQNNNSIKHILFYLIVCLSLASSNSLMAQTKTWTGASDTNWANASNWNPVGVPTATDDVTIPNTANNPTIQNGTTVTINSLQNDKFSVLTIQTTAELNVLEIASQTIINRGEIDNAGKIYIGQTTPINNTAIENAGFHAIFTNQATGEIQIDKGSPNTGGLSGILNNSAANFINKGLLEMQGNGAGAFGLTTLNNSDFSNEANGTINLINASSSSQIRVAGINTIFNNAGNINIEGRSALQSIASGKIINKADGMIDINVSVFAIVTGGNGSLQNDACGTIYTSAEIVNTSMLNNAGFLYIDYEGTHKITGTFTNTGAIEDRYNSLEPYNITNENIIIAPSSCNSSDSVFPDILKIGNNNTFTVSTDWYSDEALTTDAGDYDQTTNTFTAATPVLSSTIFYMQLTDDNNTNCPKVMAINVETCSAEAGVLNTNADEICADGNVEASATGLPDGDYLQYFFVYEQDDAGNTTFMESMTANTQTGESSADFSGLAAGNYLVCSYNESQDCLPNPSPITTELDDIYETGNIQDGCYDIECATIIVPEAFEANIEGSGSATQTGTGMNVFIAEVCGGTAPYSSELTSTGGFASVEELPSENVGCINYQIVYSNGVDWTLTIMDDNDCSNNDVVFNSADLPSNPLPQITSVTTTQETCPSDADGSITVEVEGGETSCEEYTYAWSGPNGFSETTTDIVTGNTLEDLAAGSYNVTVTDCAGTTTVQTGINVTRSNIGGRRGRGSGVCKTTGNESWNENESLNVYPNLFGERTMIEFSVIETSNVWLSVYSMDGRKVASILEGERMEGEVLQRYDFEAINLESGMYLLELQTESGLRQHQQLVVVK